MVLDESERRQYCLIQLKDLLAFPMPTAIPEDVKAALTGPRIQWAVQDAYGYQAHSHIGKEGSLSFC